MTYIRFDPQDSSTRDFLEKIGLPEEMIDKGEVNPLMESFFHINLGSVQVLSALNQENINDEYLSKDEAEIALNLINSRGLPILRLFSNSGCPGYGVTSAPIILENILGQNIGNRYGGGNIIPEILCPYDMDYSVEDQRGIHFLGNLVPESIKKAGKAVALVAFKWGDQMGMGSAVVISEKGDILTAWHVLYDENDNFRDKVYIRIRDKVIEVREKDVVSKDKKRDTLLLRIDQIATIGLSPMKVSAMPPLAGEEIWLIGFAAREGDGDELRKPTFTVGRVKEIAVSIDDLSSTIVSSALATDGDSGGAVVNKSGELVGTTTQINLNGLVNVLLSNPDASYASMPPGVYRGTPDDFKKAFNEWPERFK